MSIAAVVRPWTGVVGVAARRAATTPSTGPAAFTRFFASTGDRVDELDDKSLYYFTRAKPEYALGKHRSNALELIEKQAVIEVEGDIAICDGGGGALGHPLEYIKVGGIGGKVVSCIYCGLKYKQKDPH